MPILSVADYVDLSGVCVLAGVADRALRGAGAWVSLPHVDHDIQFLKFSFDTVAEW